MRSRTWLGRVFAPVAALAVCVAALSGEAQAGRKFLTIGTAAVTGAYYPVGGTICRFVTMRMREHGINCAVQSTGGTIFNLNAVRQQEVDVGFAQSDGQYNAWHGEGLFADAGADRDLRSLFSLYSEAFTVVARGDAGIASFDGLKGKRVNLGNQGSGMRATMDEVLEAKGWGKNVFALATAFKASEQGEKLCGGAIDAFVFATGHPNGAIEAVTSQCDARLVDVSGPAIDRLLAEHTYFAPATIPGGMYKGNPSGVSTFGVTATLVASKDVDDELIYQLVKSVFENFDHFKTTHPILSTLDKKRMLTDGLTAPLHDGAKRYYRETGLLEE